MYGKDSEEFQMSGKTFFPSNKKNKCLKVSCRSSTSWLICVISLDDDLRGRLELCPQFWLLWDFCSPRFRLFEAEKKEQREKKKTLHQCMSSIYSTCRAGTSERCWKHPLKARLLWGYLIKACLWCTYSWDYSWRPKVGRERKNLKSHKKARGSFKDYRWICVIWAVIGAGGDLPRASL